MQELIGLKIEDLKEKFANISDKKFLANQVYAWLYHQGVTDFDDMSNISKKTVERLKENFTILRPNIVKDLVSRDGTRKWLIDFGLNSQIEMVYIPTSDRGTLCISSQIGCTLTCKFCHTGTQMLVRNLSGAEIITQFMLAKDKLDDWKMGDKKGRKITNIVFMGMGEPFFNYDNVKEAINFINDDKGLAFSRRRITVSTSGLVDQIIKAADEINCELAVSLHSASDEVRDFIMPINKKYPLKELMEACVYYNSKNKSRITFEYVMLDGVNDSLDDARKLVDLVKSYKINAIINLIPFNFFDGAQFRCSSNNKIHNFKRFIMKNSLPATVRLTRGEDVMAACGQLKSISQRLKKG